MNTISILTICIVFSFLIITLLTFLIAKSNKKRKHLSRLLEKYKDIIDVDEEIDKRTQDFLNESEKFEKQISDSKADLTNLKDKYLSAKTVFEQLTRENRLLQDSLEIAEFGVYEPHFELETSEEYKMKLVQNKDRQKELIKDGNAAICNTPWTVEGSRKKGEIMERKAIKLTLRAFNGECDSLIAKVKWNNIEQSGKRIENYLDKQF